MCISNLLFLSKHNMAIDKLTGDDFVASLFSNNDEPTQETINITPCSNSLRWVDVEFAELPHPLFYDACGQLLACDQVSVIDIRKQFAFVVTCRHQVIARQFADVGVAIVTIDDAMHSLCYVPVQPSAITITRNGSVELTCDVLKTNLQLTLDDNMETLLSNDRRILSLSCYMNSFRHCQPHAFRSQANDGFELSMSLLKLQDVRTRTNHIGAWSRSHQMYRALIDVHFFDVADLLEFYYVCSEWIWRSRLGFYVLHNYIVPLVSKSGNSISCPNVFAIVNSWSFMVNKHPPQQQRCDFCKRECVLQHQVRLDKCCVLTVDETCLIIMDVLFFITATLRNFRILANFEFSRMEHIVHVLSQARKRMHSLHIF